jgi:hypothetical protein
MYPIYHRLASELALQMSPPNPGLWTFHIDLVGPVDGHPIHVRRVIGRAGHVFVETQLLRPLDLGLAVSHAGVFTRMRRCFGFTGRGSSAPTCLPVCFGCTVVACPWAVAPRNCVDHHT